MLLIIIAATTLFVTAVLAIFLWRVPDGEDCPQCGMETLRRPVSEASRGGYVQDRWTVARSCTACRWSGRARFTGEPQAIRPGPQARGTS